MIFSKDYQKDTNLIESMKGSIRKRGGGCIKTHSWAESCFQRLTLYTFDDLKLWIFYRILCLIWFNVTWMSNQKFSLCFFCKKTCFHLFLISLALSIYLIYYKKKLLFSFIPIGSTTFCKVDWYSGNIFQVSLNERFR